MKIIKLKVSSFLLLLITLTSCGGGGGGGTPEVQTLPAPTGVLATEGAGDGTVMVNWDSVSGADSYTLYWATAADYTAGNLTPIHNAISPYVHAGRNDNVTYYYVVVAVDGNGEGDRSVAASATTRPPRISGQTAMEQLQITYTNSLPAGGVYAICLYDLAWEDPNGCDTTTEPGCNCSFVTEPDPGTGDPVAVLTNERSFEFEVRRGQAYIIVAEYGGGQAFAAITPTVTQDIIQNINIDSETAMNLISVVELELNGVDPADLSPLADRIDELLTKANETVDRLNLFFSDRNTYRDADRFVEAVRNFAIDRANQGSAVFVNELDGPTIRAYGGGTGEVRTLDALLESPLTPLNPHFTFTRESSTDEFFDVAMSDLETVRWDYIADMATSPHISTGGTKVVYTGVEASYVNSGGYYVQGVYVKDLGADNATRITPNDLHCLTPTLSPDESKIIFAGAYVDLTSIVQPNLELPFNIFVMNTDGTGLSQLTFDTEFPSNPASETLQLFGNYYTDWSPDGQWVTFARYTLDAASADDMISGIEKLRVVPAGTGTGYTATDRTLVFDTDANVFGTFLGISPSWSTDGSEIWFAAATVVPEVDYDIYIIDASGDTGTLRHYPKPGTQEANPSISHDGRFVVYAEATGTGPALKVMNRYTGEVIADLGDFANATHYYYPRFTATDAVMVAVEGVDTTSDGTVIVEGDDARTTSTSTSSYNYYREIIPAANSIGINFNVTSWY